MKKLNIKYYRIIMLAVSGVLTSLALIFPQLGFIQWLSLVPAAIVLADAAADRQKKIRSIYGYGIIFFICYYLVIYHWFLYMYPLEFAGISKGAALAVVIIAWIGLSLIQTVWSAFVFVVFALVARLRILKNRNIVLPLFAAAIWAIFEWSQTIGWWGVPWGRMCLGQVHAPILLGSASILGSYFVTFTIVAVNFSIAYAYKCKDLRKVLAACAVVLFGFNLAMGVLATLTYRDEGESIKVAAVQGNISSTEKWATGNLEKTLSIHERYTKAAAEAGADIVVWSETAIPYNFFNSSNIMNCVSEIARENNVTILVSAFTEHDGRSWELYNSLFEVRPDGSYSNAIYSKQRLVPFGEFVPMREVISTLIPPLAEIGMLREDLIAGEESIVLPTESGKVGCGICFDSIYENITREASLNGAEIIAIATNDSWFGDSAALSMHNSQSMLRAIETGKYVVRSANTGISSIIDPKGNIMQQLPANVDGYVIDEVYLNNTVTPYTALGNVFVYVCIISVVSVLILSPLYDLYIKRKRQ